MYRIVYFPRYRSEQMLTGFQFEDRDRGLEKLQELSQAIPHMVFGLREVGTEHVWFDEALLEPVPAGQLEPRMGVHG